jgi:XRE family transcriptional regulator, regulator of sulfur utilization
LPEVDTTIDDLTRRVGDIVRAERQARGLSLGELARESGLSKSLLARLETQGGNPSIDTLWRLARALALPMAALLDEPAVPHVRRIAARSGRHLKADDGMHAWLVHAEGRSHRSELFEIELPPGLDRRADAHMLGTEELVACLDGHALVGPVGHEVELAAGDAATFGAAVPHRYGSETGARLLNWIIYPRE